MTWLNLESKEEVDEFAAESPADGGDLLQLRRPAHLLRDYELLFCRERISPARAVLRSESGVVTAAKGLDRVVGLLYLGHRCERQ